MTVFKKENVQMAQQSFDSRFTGVVAGADIFIMVNYRQADNTVAVAERQITFYLKSEHFKFQ